MLSHAHPRRRIAAVLAAAGAIGLTAGGCESLKTGARLTPQPPDAAAQAPPAPKTPGKHWLRVSQYVFYSDARLDPADPLFRELEELPEQIQSELSLPPGESLVQVFLFETQEKYEAFLKARFPKLPTRRAYFISVPRAGGGDDLFVYTWLGDNLRTDLRHELTHATLHGVLKGVPIWLDEGLASFFELPPANGGVNLSHLEVLRRGPFLPDLGRLEKLGQVAQMEKPEYREAWAWVYLMLRGRPEARQVLLDYVRQLRTTPAPGPLQPRLQAVLPDPNQALAEQLARAEIVPASARERVGR